MNKMLVSVVMLATVSFGAPFSVTRNGAITSYVFQPVIEDYTLQSSVEFNDHNPNDLRDLPHGRAYSWAEDFTLGANEVITGAVFEITNLNNWAGGSNALYIDLLNNVTIDSDPNLPAARNVNRYFDGTGDGTGSDANEISDYFRGQIQNSANGIRIDKIEDRGNYLWSYYYLDVANDNVQGGSYGNGVDDVSIAFNAYQIGKLTEYLANGNFGFGIDADCHFYNDGFKFTITTESTSVPEPGLLSLLGFGLLGLLAVRRKK